MVLTLKEQFTQKHLLPWIYLDLPVWAYLLLPRLLPVSHVAPVSPSAGGAGRLLERADWRMSGSAELSPPTCGRDQSAEALRL